MMRYIIILAIAMFALTANANTNTNDRIRWYSFEEAVELAVQNPRKILIDVYTDWCGFCKRMDAETFNNPQVARYINENYYPVKLNSETTDTIYFKGHQFVNEGGGRRSPHQLSIALLQGQMSYPSVVYINEDLELLTAVPGFMGPADIEPILRYFAEDYYLNTSWESFTESFTGTFR